MNKIRLAIVVSHPIQHFVHFYRALAAREDLVLKVFFCSRMGMEEYFDKDMGTVIQWADDMTGGFDHEFLPEAEAIKDTRFHSINNPSIAVALDAFRPNVVIIYGYSQLTQLRVLFWSIIKGIPALMITDSNAVTQRSVVNTVLRQTILRFVLSRVAGFLTVGDQNETALETLGVPRARMHRSPFTIDEGRYRQASNDRLSRRAAIRSEYRISDDAFVGIFVGKLIVRKRTEDAVRAFARVAENVNGSTPPHLLVCGNGPDLERTTEVIRALGVRATLAGFVNVDRLPDYFCAADALVHPAEHDPHPLICSEAASIGLPMILSDMVGTIGPTDISRNGENALVYPCGDVEALADAIARLATDHRLLNDMSAASLRIFEECSLKASVKGLISAVRAAAPANDETTVGDPWARG